MKLIFSLILLVMTPFSISGSLLPSRLFFRLETGFGFSTYSSLNEGIQNANEQFVAVNGPDAEGKNFKQLDFDIPLLLKVGIRPFFGSVGKNIVLYARTGYIITYSLNTINLNSIIQTYEYQLGILPMEIGIDYQLLRLYPITLYGGFSLGMYMGFFSKNEDSISQKYTGSGLGINFYFTTTLQISSKLSLVGNLQYRYANISSLKNNNNEQLYITSTGFQTSQTQPVDSSQAQINLSGMGISFGIQYSFGDQRLTDIPEGVYR